MEQEVKSVLSRLERKDAEERTLNLPASGRLLALHPDSGKYLYIIGLSTKAKRIVEIGSGVGYSTIWLALAAKANDGKVISFEIDQPRAAKARANLAEAGLQPYVEIIEGDARNNLHAYEGMMDLLFIDAAKSEYKNYLDLAYPYLKPGSLVIADNLISHADVLKEYRQYMESHPDFSSALVPLGRGLEISVKTS